MANKAVLGAMAVGMGGYAASEAIKEWQVKREKEDKSNYIVIERPKQNAKLRR
jgi:hypothetical protein